MACGSLYDLFVDFKHDVVHIDTYANDLSAEDTSVISRGYQRSSVEDTTKNIY